MEHIVSQIHKALIEKRKNIAVAESCTGGLLSSFLTRISGSSKYFILGVITYSNTAKTKILNIPARLITQKGAVSDAVAQKMAQAVKTMAKTDFGVGITGIAGPTGGTPQKPKGTVFIAVEGKNKSICRRFIFTGIRQVVRKKAALKALELLKLLLK